MKDEKKMELMHHNDFHNIQFQNFNVKERNVIFALCYKAMHQGSDLLSFHINEIKELSNYSQRKKGDSIYKLLEETYRQIKNATIRIDKTDGGIKEFVLFTKFETFPKDERVEFKVNEEYKYLINNVTSNFTKQNLLEYAYLQSSYSQLLYSLLRKWNSKHELNISMEDFKKNLAIPESYRLCDIDSRVFKPIMKELSQYFKNLTLEKIKSGKKITHLKFTWQDDKKEIKTPKVIEIKISENLSNSLEKGKKNRYLEGILVSSANIEKLLKEFTEPQLIKGLEKAYKVVDKPVKSLLYLKKIIRSANEEAEKVVVVADTKTSKKKSEVELKDLKQNNVEQSCFKTRVTKAEYERIYEEYLKQNNVKHQKIIRDSFDIMKKNQFEIID